MRLVQVAGAELEHFDQAGLVKHGVGIRRTHQRGHATGHGGGHLRFERRLVFVARLTQAGGQVDEPRTDDQPGGVDGLVGVEIRWRAADADHLARGEVQILLRVDAVGRVDQAAALDMQFHRSS